MGSNAWIKTNALNDFARIESLTFGICVVLVEVGDPERQIRVGE